MTTATALDPGEEFSKARLRLWIRLYRAARFIETELRERLRREFDMTLPRFDVLAALYRQRDGMLMSELSRALMVSNGNVTGIVDRLAGEGLIARTRRNGDRRTSIVRLTPEGFRYFRRIAAVHEGWVDELLGVFGPREVEQLSQLLKPLKPEHETDREDQT
ncbi:MAG: MarR family transcriptional regulator [Gammaproteobacteria bacterium]|nr:MarR family transcriptional regulator [Gammaproteobacteria bacterium]